MEEQSSLFQATSEKFEISRKDRARRFADVYFFTPISIIWDDQRARFGSAIVLLYLVMGIIGPRFVEPPSPIQGPILLAPFTDWAYPLGTTGLGKDLLALMIYSTPFIFEMMIAGGIFTVVLGTVVGLVSGYVGGFIDRILTLASDVMVTIPGLPLFLVLAVFLNPTNPIIIGIVLSANRWAGLARQIRSQVLAIKTENYLEASMVMGVEIPRILYFDILPNIMPYVLIRFVGAARGIIFSSVALYFLGILPSSSENWGVTLQNAYSTGGALTNPNAFHWLLVPMVTIVLLSYGLTLLAQSADKLFNPRIRAKHESKK